MSEIGAWGRRRLYFCLRPSWGQDHMLRRTVLVRHWWWKRWRQQRCLWHRHLGMLADALLTAGLHAGDASVTAVAAAVATATKVAATVVAQTAAPRDVSAVAWFALVLRMVVATTSGTGAEGETIEKATEVKLVAVGVAAVAMRAVG